MLEKFVDLRYAKSDDYRKVLEEIQREGKCPFCPENFRWHRKPILKEGGHWFLTKAAWPYQDTKFHFLIIGREHKEKLPELSWLDLTEVIILANWAARKFRIKGGGISLRFGDTDYTGATVKHLHFHLIVPEKGKTVNFPIG